MFDRLLNGVIRREQEARDSELRWVERQEQERRERYTVMVVNSAPMVAAASAANAATYAAARPEAGISIRAPRATPDSYRWGWDPAEAINGFWGRGGVEQSAIAAIMAGPSIEERRASVALLERPTGAPYQLPPVMPSAKYLELAAKIGADTTPAILKARVQSFLAERGWPVYPRPKVDAYLQSLAARETERWRREGNYQECRVVWMAYRRQDAVNAQSALYPLQIPPHAMEKIATMEEVFPAGLQFCVSHYESVRPDPFLLVRAGGEEWVIDVWDEPGW